MENGAAHVILEAMRAIAGLSMGGAEATFIGLNHLEVWPFWRQNLADFAPLLFQSAR